MTGLDPTVTGVLVAGGAAIIGFGASALNTGATLRANRQAGRDERLWAKKTALYGELYAAASLVDGVFDRVAPSGRITGESNGSLMRKVSAWQRGLWKNFGRE
jgi:hypothetical protein